MIVSIDPSSPTPPFEQLRIAIRQHVLTGDLPVGSRLPTVRRLAADLGVAPGTVGRAFRELEAEGLIESRGRHGTHVIAVPARPKAPERERRIRDAARSYVALAAELSLDADTAIQAVRDAFAR